MEQKAVDAEGDAPERSRLIQAFLKVVSQTHRPGPYSCCLQRPAARQAFVLGRGSFGAEQGRGCWVPTHTSTVISCSRLLRGNAGCHK